MIYCLYGDAKSLDVKLSEILRKLDLDDGTFFDLEVVAKPKGKTSKKDSKRMEDESGGIIQKMSKIDINKDDKEIENIIKQAMGQGLKAAK